MNKIMITAALVVAMLAMTACGSSGTTRTYETQNQPMYEQEPATPGDSIVVSNSGEGNVGMSYTKISDGSVLVDCGDGGCGDVFAGNETSEDISSGSSDGSCEAGFTFSSVEGKCVPSGTEQTL